MAPRVIFEWNSRSISFQAYLCDWLLLVISQHWFRKWLCAIGEPASGTKPLHNSIHVLTQICVTMWHHKATRYFWDPFHKWLFHHNSNLVKISFSCHAVYKILYYFFIISYCWNLDESKINVPSHLNCVGNIISEMQTCHFSVCTRRSPYFQAPLRVSSVSDVISMFFLNPTVIPHKWSILTMWVAIGNEIYRNIFTA